MNSWTNNKKIAAGVVVAILFVVVGWGVELFMLKGQSEVWVSGPVSVVATSTLQIDTRHEMVTVAFTPETMIMMKREALLPEQLRGRFVSIEGHYRPDGVFEALFIRVLEPKPYAQ